MYLPLTNLKWRKCRHYLGTKLIDVIPILAIVFGSFLGIIIATLVYAAYTEKKDRQYKLALAQLDKSASGNTVHEKEIIKEIVMIPCQYCGALIPQTSLFCNNCGAQRKLWGTPPKRMTSLNSHCFSSLFVHQTNSNTYRIRSPLPKRWLIVEERKRLVRKQKKAKRNKRAKSQEGSRFHTVFHSISAPFCDIEQIVSTLERTTHKLTWVLIPTRERKKNTCIPFKLPLKMFSSCAGTSSLSVIEEKGEGFENGNNLFGCLVLSTSNIHRAIIQPSRFPK